MTTDEFDAQLKRAPQIPEFSRRSIVAGVMRNREYGVGPLDRLDKFIRLLNDLDNAEEKPLLKTARQMKEEYING